MRTATSLTLTLAFLSTTIATALAETVVTPSCTRLTGLEKAQCQVKQHQLVMYQLGRGPAPSSYPSNKSLSSASSASSVSAVQSSSSAAAMSGASSSSTSSVVTCSRLDGKAKAQCLVQLHKQTKEYLAKNPIVVKAPAPVVRAAHCNRYTDKIQRAACLAGNRPGSSSSSSASSQ